MPNIENLRKQAKLHVRWHRERYHAVAEQIRSFVPRFKEMSDWDILNADFKLNDAQELIARQHGFEDWPALIKGVSSITITSDSTDTKPVIIAAEPQIFVLDIEVACQYYTQKLGFQLAFSYGEPPFYAQVVRNGGRLNLRKVSAPAFDSTFRARECDALSATFTLNDVKSLFLEYQRSGVTFHQNLRSEPWGARTFIVQDTDGNLIAFSGR